MQALVAAKYSNYIVYEDGEDRSFYYRLNGEWYRGQDHFEVDLKYLEGGEYLPLAPKQILREGDTATILEALCSGLCFTPVNTKNVFKLKNGCLREWTGKSFQPSQICLSSDSYSMYCTIVAHPEHSKTLIKKATFSEAFEHMKNNPGEFVAEFQGVKCRWLLGNRIIIDKDGRLVWSYYPNDVIMDSTWEITEKLDSSIQ